MLARFSLFFSILFLAFIAGMVFQNCGQSFDLNSDVAGGGPVSPIRFRDSNPAQPKEVLITAARDFRAFDYGYKSGTINATCFSLNTSDTCVFAKSPFYGAALVSAEIKDAPPGDANPDHELQRGQVLGVSLSPWVTNNQLKNSHFDVYISDAGLPLRMTLENNKWQHGFTFGHNPNQSHSLYFATEQVQTFYYLNLFRDVMNTDGGGFYASGGTISVNAVSAEDGPITRYDPTTRIITLGVRMGQGGRYYPMALNAELTIVEAAHANFFAANPQMIQEVPNSVYVLNCNSGHPHFLTDSNNLKTNEASVLNRMRVTCGHARISGAVIVPYCGSDRGCWRAIEYGQADFYAYVMFASWPTIGDLALPPDRVRYWKKRSDINRANVASKLGFDYYDDYSQQNVEIPADAQKMGEVFSEILFDIYVDTTVDRPTFLKTVSKFLPMISSTTTFTEAKTKLISIDQAQFASRNGGKIKSYFEGRGF